MYLGSRNAPTAEFPGKRRLVLRLYTLIHSACDIEEIAVAQEILFIVEKLLLSRSFNLDSQRRFAELHVAAHERLWKLHHIKPEP